MKIAVVGATGRTGRQVAGQALARGDDVIALARHPEALPLLGPGLVAAAADVLDRAAVAQALAGADAVVSALGIGASRQPTVVYSDGTANVLHAMDAHGIRRLAVISAVPAGPRAEQPVPPGRIRRQLTLATRPGHNQRQLAGTGTLREPNLVPQHRRPSPPRRWPAPRPTVISQPLARASRPAR
jgi:nucleoside-diphosphate-sugar epimerase